MRTILGLTAALMMTGSAVAADMARPMPVKAPPLAIAQIWDGWYGGIHAGYGWNDPTATFNPATFATVIAAANPGLTVNGSSGPFSLAVQPEGGFGGIQFGRNWQSGNIVYGFEIDASLADISDSAARNFSVLASDPDNLDFTGTFFLSRKIDALGTLRGRLGWANNTLLIYGTGGLAVGHVKTSMGVSNIVAANPANFSLPPSSYNRSVSSTDTQFGAALGAGAEWMFMPRWSLKGEYQFIWLGGGTSLAFPGASFTDSKVQLHTVRLGLNYKFSP
jgi:outer membrane immunogenic protein